VKKADDGMTLIELLVVLVILPLVVGAIVVSMLSVFKLQTGVSGRLVDTAYGQAVSSTYVRDVEGSSMITTTSTSSPLCGTGTQILGLEWSGGVTGTNYQSVVSYVYQLVTTTTPNTYVLHRNYCNAGQSSVPSTSNTLANDLQNIPTSCLVVGAIGNPCSASPLVSAAGVSLVQITINELVLKTSTTYTYTFKATPRLWTSVSGGIPPTPVQTAFAPITLTGAPGPCTAGGTLTQGGGSSRAIISINTAAGPGTGILLIGSSCPGSVSINGTLNVGGVASAAPNLDSVTGATVTEYPLTTIVNPLSALSPPSDATPDRTKADCTKIGKTYTCPPGNYTDDPTAPSSQNGYTFNFTGAGDYSFQKGLTSFGNGDTVNFGGGNKYRFDGTNVPVLTDGNNVSINVVGAGGILLYAPAGWIDFSNGGTIALTPLTPISKYFGITIWDNASTAEPTAHGSGTVVLSNNSGGTSAGCSGVVGYGGVYVPNGSILAFPNSVFPASFLYAQSGLLDNNVTVTVTSC
jgi:prepilin-type N-terminal cleavage/methylation domain-containing protein